MYSNTFARRRAGPGGRCCQCAWQGHMGGGGVRGKGGAWDEVAHKGKAGASAHMSGAHGKGGVWGQVARKSGVGIASVHARGARGGTWKSVVGGAGGGGAQ